MARCVSGRPPAVGNVLPLPAFVKSTRNSAFLFLPQWLKQLKLTKEQCLTLALCCLREKAKHWTLPVLFRVSRAGISIVASVLTIVCMAFDRYFAIRHPMKNRQIFTVRRVKHLIVVTWVLAAILVIPLLVVRKVSAVPFCSRLAGCPHGWVIYTGNLHLSPCWLSSWLGNLHRQFTLISMLAVLMVR